MSAFVVVYTRSPGFIIAADGKTSVDEGTVITASIAARLVNDSQKIFEIPGKKIGYFVSGLFEDDDMIFNMKTEIAKQLVSLSDTAFDSGHAYVLQLAKQLKAAILEAQRNGLKFSDGKDVTGEDGISFVSEIMFLGYWTDQPFAVECIVNHRNQEVSIRFIPVNGLHYGYLHEIGSRVLPGLALSDDPSFAKYKDGLLRPYAKSLEDAHAYADTFISLCSDPLAAQIDSTCAAIGGHIHIAEITPQGFRWRICPKKKGDS